MSADKVFGPEVTELDKAIRVIALLPMIGQGLWKNFGLSGGVDSGVLVVVGFHCEYEYLSPLRSERRRSEWGEGLFIMRDQRGSVPCTYSSSDSI
jgi:hypothetical protein